MTTNHPGNLDEALMRPKRIDSHVHFENATKEQAEKLFLAMYTQLDNQNMANLDKLATQYSSSIPERQFSPAQIQGFLLIHKRTPHLAAQSIKEWISQQRDTQT
ncbi:hypothetical protein F5B19DRAFT_479486 [Rostrohypoxylon terebratum]|nr:hypothetical protein F5B19DRAFT_479486 [Rostrohypoxylon terebratum]